MYLCRRLPKCTFQSLFPKSTLFIHVSLCKAKKTLHIFKRLFPIFGALIVTDQSRQSRGQMRACRQERLRRQRAKKVLFDWIIAGIKISRQKKAAKRIFRFFFSQFVFYFYFSHLLKRVFTSRALKREKEEKRTN